MSASFRNLVTAGKVLEGIAGCPNQCFNNGLWMIDNLDKLDAARARWFYEERSSQIFDWVMQCRLVTDFYGGSDLPADWEGTPFPAPIWKKLVDKATAMTSGFVEGDYILDRIDTWLLESYSLKGFCEALPGDAVLDCGTFSGNTSLYFAQKVGPTGHVWGFEPSPSVFARYAENMRGLGNVTPVHAAVHDRCGIVALLGEGGVGAQIRDIHANASTGCEVPAVTLDGFFLAAGLKRVDFIKMDVEGAEVNALLGAKKIIRTWLPKMALSAYHRADDLIRIPECIESIAPGRYSFRLRHYSDNIYETVLFCAPSPETAGAEGKGVPEAVPDTAAPRREDALALVRAFYLVLQRGLQGRMKPLFDVASANKKLADELLEERNLLQKENQSLRALLESGMKR